MGLLMRVETDKMVTCVHTFLLRLKRLNLEGGVRERRCVNRAPKTYSSLHRPSGDSVYSGLGKGEEWGEQSYGWVAASVQGFFYICKSLSVGSLHFKRFLDVAIKCFILVYFKTYNQNILHAARTYIHITETKVSWSTFTMHDAFWYFLFSSILIAVYVAKVLIHY